MIHFSAILGTLLEADQLDTKLAKKMFDPYITDFDDDVISKLSTTHGGAKITLERARKAAALLRAMPAP